MCPTDELSGKLYKDDKSEFDLTKQNRQTTRMGTRTATKQVTSISLQECVEHKQFRATAKDRPVGVARTKLTWQVGVSQRVRGRE